MKQKPYPFLKSQIVVGMLGFTLPLTAQQAIWSFDTLTGVGDMTNIPPTAETLDGTPGLFMQFQDIEPNGVQGIAYTDSTGINRPAGSAMSWADIKGPGAEGEWTLSLSTVGLSTPAIRFNYRVADDSNGSTKQMNLQYSVDGGPFADIRRIDLIDNNTWNEFSTELSSIAAIQNQPDVRIRLSANNLPAATEINRRVSFDNLEIFVDTSPIVAVAPTNAAYTNNISGVLGDSTDPLQRGGMKFIAENGIITSMSAISSNQNVVNNAMLIYSPEAGTSRYLRIIPQAAGRSTITVTFSFDDGTTKSLELDYRVSETNNSSARFHTFASDASSAIGISDDYMLVANDERGPQIHLFSRKESGTPEMSWDFSDMLNLNGPREVDVEASTRVGNRVFWLGSLGNNSSGECRPNRNRLFATDITIDGAQTTVTYAGHYERLREDLIAWDTANGSPLGLEYSADCQPTGRPPLPPKSQNGFNLEGLAMAPDGSTAYLGFRAPISPATNRTRALIVPIRNFISWFDSNNPTLGGEPVSPAIAPEFGDPILLDLQGRGIRSIESNAKNEYLIVGGSFGDFPGTAPDGDMRDFRLYGWSGKETDTEPYLINSISQTQGGSIESIVEVPTPLAGSQVQILNDNGSSDWYNSNEDSKELPRGHQKFASDWITLPAASDFYGTYREEFSLRAIDENGYLYGVKSATSIGAYGSGRLQVRDKNWNVLATTSEAVRSPLVAAGENVISSSGSDLISFTPDTLTEVWRYSIPQNQDVLHKIIDKNGNIYFTGDPNVGGNTANLGFYAVNRDGVEKWTFSLTQDDADAFGTPAVRSDGVVYVATEEPCVIYAFNPESGSILWTHDVPERDALDITIGADDVIRFVTYNSSSQSYSLLGVNPNGTRVPPISLSSGFGSVDSRKLLFDSQGDIWFGGINGNTYSCYRSSGQFETFEVPEISTGSVNIDAIGPDGVGYGHARNLSFFGGGPSRIFAFNTIDGSILWTKNIDLYVTDLMLAQNGFLYYSSFEGSSRGGDLTIGSQAIWTTSSWNDLEFVEMMSKSGDWRQFPTERHNIFNTKSRPVRGDLRLPGLAQLKPNAPASTNINKNIAWPYALGYHFTPKVNGTLTSLGGFFDGEKTVKVFDRSTGEMLAEQRVFSNNKRWGYREIEPLPLLANTSYTVAAYLEGEGAAYFSGTPSTYNNDFVTLDGSTYGYTGNNPDAIPTANQEMTYCYGLSDLTFRPDGESVWANSADQPTGLNINWNFAMGYHFTPLQNGYVTSLGGLFNGTKVVKLFNKETGELLASASVSSENDYSYSEIPLVKVEAGTQYTVAVYLDGSGASYYPYQPDRFPATFGQIRIDGSTYISTFSNPDSRPVNNFTQYSWGQADIKFVPAP